VTALPARGAGTTGATVVRLNRDADERGLAAFRSAGMRVASSADFRGEGLPADLDGADILVFERFGLAIVDADPGRVAKALAEGVASHSVVSHRAERIYRALSMRESRRRDYLLGFRAGVDALVSDLLGEDVRGRSAEAQEAPELDETTATWGLQATGVVASRFAGRGVKLAVLDTGIDTAHPDFLGRVTEAMSFVRGEDVMDHAGHGTHCAGTACGPLRASGGLPRYGVAHDAQLYVGKVLDNAGFGSDRTVIAGLEWALDAGCAIISLSLGGATAADEPFDENYELIGRNALESRSLIIAAAGNESDRPFSVAPVASPANCPSIFAVAAVDERLRVAGFSSGKRSRIPGGEINLSGPGVGVLSALPLAQGGSGRLRGTSMATPHVAGIAALYAENDSSLRGLALWGGLLRGARYIGGDAGDVGQGLVYAP